MIFSAGAEDEPPALFAGSSLPHAAETPSAAVITDATASILPRRILFIIPDPSQVVARSLGGASRAGPDSRAPRCAGSRILDPARVEPRDQIWERSHEESPICECCVNTPKPNCYSWGG
ncbi:hypothetical protein Sru01_22480 [Sphaerisporangium rufum]|uniref:Uncharacterized protein n=1 Tax=Sphaerisporangium rufum TaxID=1381558 RepID=A0A919R2M0_9ACTN|nr:hypothetical protein Sru01_22480 [Sphaerisporangium rufum]